MIGKNFIVSHVRITTPSGMSNIGFFRIPYQYNNLGKVLSVIPTAAPQDFDNAQTKFQFQDRWPVVSILGSPVSNSQEVLIRVDNSGDRNNYNFTIFSYIDID